MTAMVLFFSVNEFATRELGRNFEASLIVPTSFDVEGVANLLPTIRKRKRISNPSYCEICLY